MKKSKTVSEAHCLLFRKEAGDRECNQVYSHPSPDRTCTVCSFQLSLLLVAWPLWQNKSLRVLHSLDCSWSFPDKFICHSLRLSSREYTSSTCAFWYYKSKLHLLAHGCKNPSRWNPGPTEIRPPPSFSLNGQPPALSSSCSTEVSQAPTALQPAFHTAKLGTQRLIVNRAS